MIKRSDNNLAIVLLVLEFILPFALIHTFLTMFGDSGNILTFTIFVYVVVLVSSFVHSVTIFIKNGKQTPSIFLILLVSPLLSILLLMATMMI